MLDLAHVLDLGWEFYLFRPFCDPILLEFGNLPHDGVC